jgi:hypothetical protein
MTFFALLFLVSLALCAQRGVTHLKKHECEPLKKGDKVTIARSLAVPGEFDPHREGKTFTYTMGHDAAWDERFGDNCVGDRRAVTYDKGRSDFLQQDHTLDVLIDSFVRLPYV